MSGYLDRLRQAVPAGLLELPVWLLWRSIPNGDEKPRKVPVYADGELRGKGTHLDTPEDRERLVTFDEAATRFDARRHAGLGIALGEVPGEEIVLSGIDLDDIAQDDPRVLEILAAANSYAETSPSGKGIKIFGTGAIGTEKRVAPDGGLEIYSRERFFTVTGERINGAHLADLTDAAEVARTHWPKPSSSRATTSQARPGGIASGGRNNTLTSLAGAMRRRGMTPEAIEAALREENARRCDPPLPDEEVRAIARSVGRYAPSAPPETPPTDSSPQLEAFDVGALLGPIEPERELLPGIPCDAYTVIAGGLSSAKTTILHSLILARATGYDFLHLGDGTVPPGPAALLTYEDGDRRVIRRFQILVQHQHREILAAYGKAAAAEYLARVKGNVRRLTLTGVAGFGIVCRAPGGNVVPNVSFVDELVDQLRAFAGREILIGLDPLRLAIVGSQNDDDGADVVVHTLNRIAGALPDCAVVVASHTSKSGAIAPDQSQAGAAYSTSGSALYSQHARSNFLMARLGAEDARKLFGNDEVSVEEIERQRVVQLTHARLSHGPESGPRYYVMRAGVLLPVRPNSQALPLAEIARRALAPIQTVILEAGARGHRASRNALESATAIGRTRADRRELIAECFTQGWLQESGSTSNKRVELTADGLAQLSPECRGESPRGAA